MSFQFNYFSYSVYYKQLAKFDKLHAVIDTTSTKKKKVRKQRGGKGLLRKEKKKERTLTYKKQILFSIYVEIDTLMLECFRKGEE